MLNAIPINNVHYFWLEVGDDPTEKLEEVAERLGHVTLLVGWNTYTEISFAYQDQLSWRDHPDFDCLDMFVLRTSQGKVNIMLTR